MTYRQAWDSATFRCGRCGCGFEVTTEGDYVRLYAAHVANCSSIPPENPLLAEPDGKVTLRRKDEHES